MSSGSLALRNKVGALSLLAVANTATNQIQLKNFIATIGTPYTMGIDAFDLTDNVGVSAQIEPVGSDSNHARIRFSYNIASGHTVKVMGCVVIQ